MKALLEAGADVHAGNDLALCWASMSGCTETVKLLLGTGADVHAGSGYALVGASEHGHTETVKALLEAGANVHAQYDRALRYASQNGHTETVKMLEAAAAKATAASKVQEAFKQIGIELTQKQAVEVFELVAGRIEGRDFGAGSPSRPSAGAKPPAPAP